MVAVESVDVNHGEIYTKPWVAGWILDLAGYTSDRDLFTMTLVEPACGNGVFVEAAAERVVTSAERAGSDFSTLRGAIRAYDLNPASVEASRTRAEKILREAGADDAAEIAELWVRNGDFLLDPISSADFVVGNPPYVRVEEINPERVEAYRAAWPTMTGRADLYVGFIERGLKLLNGGGQLGYICADRWMRNSYGKKLRQFIDSETYSVDVVVSMHDVDCFDDEVSAYPAITVVSSAPQSDGVVVSTTSDFLTNDTLEVDEFIRSDKRSIERPAWNAVRLDGWFGSSMWPEGTSDELFTLRNLESRFDPLEDILRMTRVGIGVATGADEVFVTEDPELVEPDRLLPMTMSRHIRDGRLEWTPTYLVNPWQAGKLVDLDDYPKLRDYYETNIDSLGGRHVAKKQPQNWYRTIDRVNEWLTDTPKILLSDMKKRITPVVEPGGLYPHHNIYWIISTRWPIKSLAGLLMSEHANLFIKAYCVKMRGGTLRFQTQYLRQIRLPDPSSIDSELMAAFELAYDESDIDRSTEAAEHVYGQSVPQLRRSL